MSKSTLLVTGLMGLALTAAVAEPPKPAATVKAAVKPSTIKQANPVAGDKGATGQSMSAPPGPGMSAPPGPGMIAPGQTPQLMATLPLPPPVDIDPPATSIEPSTPDAGTHYTVLMDVNSGKILWSRNPEVRREIASTTKVMTAILLLEKGRLNDLVTGPPGIDKVEESSLHLVPGETISVHDLLYAMLLRSANDTAVAGADYIAGSLPAFADLMNQKAKDIGATNTHFVTPNGLYDPKHYSSAADMAKITRYAVLNLPEFNQIVRTQTYKVQRSVHKDDSWVKNTASKFLKEFPGADGVKTGYIHQAGHCFIGSATRNGWRMIAVALNSNQCREDVESILNYGFHNYRRVQVVYKDEPAGSVTVATAATPVPVAASTELVTAVSRWHPDPSFSYKLTPLPALPAAPIAAGTKLGTITVLSGGTVQGTVDAVAAETVAAKPAPVAIVPHLPHGNSFLLGLARFLGALALVVMGGRIYARTVAKGSGGSRDRVASQLRGTD